MGDLTFLFTDVVGSVQLWESDPDVMAKVLAEHDVAIAAAVGAQGGTVLKTKGEGDSTVSVFPDAAAAIGAAASAQRTVPLPVRMAIHTGPAESRDGDYFGPTLNRAARLRSIAHGGQIVCSEAAARAADGSLDTGLSLLDVGLHRLKDLTAPEQVYQLAGAGLPTDFPPLHSLNRSTTNLPAQHSSFVGRLAELGHVHSLLAESRLVTLVGTGGSGKTRLSIEAAAEAFDLFPDGVWFCELAPISDGDDIARVVAAAANIALSAGDATAQTTAALSDHTALVILDNCEHLIEPAAAFTAALLAAAPAVRVLATSRERLRLRGESAWPVPPLSVDGDDARAAGSEAVQLFLERARAVAPALHVDEATLRDAIAVCRRVEGVPLAIELAAARVRLMSVHDLRVRLDAHWDILRGGDRDTLPHQRSLRATIDWSYTLLTPAAQQALAHLAVFRGGFELAAAEHLLVALGFGEDEALDVVQDLVDKSLAALDPDTGRYRMLETVREFALEHLESAGLLEVTQRAHSSLVVSLLRDAEDRLLEAKEQANAFLLVTREHDNIVAALAWSLEHDHDVAGQLIGYSFAPWYGLGKPETAMWYRRMLPYAGELEGETAARACTALGAIFGYLGDKDIAYPLLDRGVETARSAGEVELLALCLSLSASVRRVYDEIDDALPLAREALAIPITSSRRVIRALVCSFAAWVLDDAGCREEARAAIIEGHQICVACEDHLVHEVILDGIGQFATDYMSQDDAFAAVQREREWLRAAGSVDQGAATVRIGWTMVRERNWEEALASIERALTLPQPHWRQVFNWQLIRASLLHLLGRFDEALALDEQLVRDATNPVDRHLALVDLAAARRDVGDLDGAEAALGEAMQYVLDGRNPAGGWGVVPTPSLAGLLLLLAATLRVGRGVHDDAGLARLVGVADGLIEAGNFDVAFSIARFRHGYEDRLPAPDPAAARYAAAASIAGAVAHGLHGSDG